MERGESFLDDAVARKVGLHKSSLTFGQETLESCKQRLGLLYCSFQRDNDGE
jgi:hypothetical protein